MKGPKDYRDFYDKSSGSLEKRSTGALGRYFYELEERYVKESVDLRGKRVLDLGTGTGRLARTLAAEAGLCVGVDFSFKGLLSASRTSHMAGRPPSFLMMDATRLGFKDGSFDMVTGLGTFECISDFAPFFSEVKRVLRPGGDFVFTCWNRDKWLDLGILDRKLPGSVEHDIGGLRSALEDSGFELISLKTTFFLPRKVFWGIYKLLAVESLRSLFISMDIRICRKLTSSEKFRHKGWEFIVNARTTR